MLMLNLVWSGAGGNLTTTQIDEALLLNSESEYFKTILNTDGYAWPEAESHSIDFASNPTMPYWMCSAYNDFLEGRSKADGLPLGWKGWSEEGYAALERFAEYIMDDSYLAAVQGWRRAVRNLSTVNGLYDENGRLSVSARFDWIKSFYADGFDNIEHLTVN